MLSKWETVFLIIMTLPIMGHVVILPLLIDIAGRDAWISILISLPFGIIFAYAIFRIRQNHPDGNALEVLSNLLGKWFSKLLVFILIVYFLFLTILSYASLVDVVYIDFLPETPRLALSLWFLFFFVYAALKGIKRIALTAGILAIIGLITGHTITLLDSPKKDWGELLPILEFGWVPIILGSLILISIWVELLFLLCIPIRNIKEKRLFLLWCVGVFLNVLMMASTTTGVITIFGLGQADNFNYPAQEIVRTINLGFIDRFDIYGMILMTFGVYIRCSLYLRIAYELSLTPKTSKWIRRAVFFFFTLICFLSAFYISRSHLRLEKIIDIYIYSFVLFPIPIFLLFISWTKKRKKKK